jgi:predicted Fe-Mo cluster-binding NifX family protein
MMKMTIALPILKDDPKADLSESLSRAPFFALIDSENHTIKTLVNPNYFQPSGAGIKVAQLLIDSHVNVLLTPRCGENAFQVLKEAGIACYYTVSSNIVENYQAFLDNRLEKIIRSNESLHQGHAN